MNRDALSLSKMGAECEGDQTEANPHAVIRLQTRSGCFCGALFECATLDGSQGEKKQNILPIYIITSIQRLWQHLLFALLEQCNKVELSSAVSSVLTQTRRDGTC